jgi:hypothetical protein
VKYRRLIRRVFKDSGSKILAAKKKGRPGGRDSRLESWRPDCLIETTDGLVPVELKSGVCPRSGPHAPHVAQLMTYYVLVEDTLPVRCTTVSCGIPMRGGVVLDNYGTHKIPNVILVCAASALSSAFHADQRVLDKSSGALVCGTHREADSVFRSRTLPAS